MNQTICREHCRGGSAVTVVFAFRKRKRSLRLLVRCTVQEWAGREFYCIPYKDSGTAVIGQTDEIQASGREEWNLHAPILLSVHILQAIAFSCLCVQLAGGVCDDASALLQTKLFCLSAHTAG